MGGVNAVAVDEALAAGERGELRAKGFAPPLAVLDVFDQGHLGGKDVRFHVDESRRETAALGVDATGTVAALRGRLGPAVRGRAVAK